MEIFYCQKSPAVHGHFNEFLQYYSITYHHKIWAAYDIVILANEWDLRVRLYKENFIGKRKEIEQAQVSIHTEKVIRKKQTDEIYIIKGIGAWGKRALLQTSYKGLFLAKEPSKRSSLPNNIYYRTEMLLIKGRQKKHRQFLINQADWPEMFHS